MRALPCKGARGESATAFARLRATWHFRHGLLALSAVLGSLLAAPAAAQIDARMLRQPDVSATPDRLRLRRRHLGGAEAGRRRRPPQLAARRGIVPALLAGRQDARLLRQLRRQHRRLHGAGAGRRSVAAHLASDGRSRARLAPRRHAGAVRLVARERPAALQPVLPRRRPRAARPRSCRSRTASSPPTRPTASSSPTCRSRRRSARGSAIAAAGRRTSGRSTWPPSASANVTASDANDEYADVARRHALLPLRSRRQPARQHLGPRQGRRACAR